MDAEITPLASDWAEKTKERIRNIEKRINNIDVDKFKYHGPLMKHQGLEPGTKMTAHCEHSGVELTTKETEMKSQNQHIQDGTQDQSDDKIWLDTKVTRGIEVYLHENLNVMSREVVSVYWDQDPLGAIQKGLLIDVKPIPRIQPPPTITYEKSGVIFQGEELYFKRELK